LHEQNLAQVTAESLREHGESKQSVPEARVILEQEEADEWVRRVQRISEGDWVLFEAFSEEPLRLKVAWIAVRTSKYIFVNALGKKERMLSADELVALLRGGSAILLDDAGEPAMDRAQFTMLQRLHRQLLHLASHDPLTGLINRGELERHVERMLTDAKVDGSKHALCLLDIDQFQVVNTTCGYEGGDALLKEVVSLLEQNLADTDVLARVGPDQFGLLLVNRSIDDALQVVEDQLARLEDYRFTWSEERISPTMSVGLTGISAQTGTVSEALQAAESSCDVAKQMGGDRIQIYYSQHAGVSRRRQDMRWAARIDRAVDEGGLFLRCQKIAPVDEQSHPRPHYELLLGLSDPLGKQEDLQAFIKAAEHHKRMIELDRWVIHNAFERITAHERELVGIESFAINLSGASLNDDRLFNYICEQLKTTGVPTDRICFEITETAGITNMSDAADFIETIKSIGCRFALDDFGNGMSSYGYLKNLAVDYLKIDGHFIEGVAGSENDQAVVKSICEIAHFMDKAVVAECVQDEAAYAVLKDIGVDYVQGYGVEPPQRLDALLES
ncbi:MAG: DUF1631 family protein, partial [Gammaproteobacteria bacterium]|nr:DUF1631 family protein [Gammaproteobacteria bacterium]